MMIVALAATLGFSVLSGGIFWTVLHIRDAKRKTPVAIASKADSETDRRVLMDLLAATTDRRLRLALVAFDEIVMAWGSRAAQMTSLDRGRGDQALAILMESCRKMAGDPVLLQSEAARIQLAQSLESASALMSGRAQLVDGSNVDEFLSELRVLERRVSDEG